MKFSEKNKVEIKLKNTGSIRRNEIKISPQKRASTLELSNLKVMMDLDK